MRPSKQKRHRKEGRRGAFPEKPLYTPHDVERHLALAGSGGLRPSARIGRGRESRIPRGGPYPGLGHDRVPGPRERRPQRLIFSGDLGQAGRPFARSARHLPQADYLVMESTYGDRTHENHGNIERQLAEVITQTVAAGGKVLIPIFAIERAQELVYYLGRLVRSQRIPRVCVYLDSPMAADVTEIFRRHQDVFTRGDPSRKSARAARRWPSPG